MMVHVCGTEYSTHNHFQYLRMISLGWDTDLCVCLMNGSVTVLRLVVRRKHMSFHIFRCDCTYVVTALTALKLMCISNYFLLIIFPVNCLANVGWHVVKV